MTELPRPHGEDVRGVHHIEMYVANPQQAAHFYRTAMGFEVVGVLVPDVATDRTSVALKQGDINIVLTAPLTTSSPVTEHIRLHGEGIKDIAFAVADADRVFHEAVLRGAEPLLRPTTTQIGSGCVRTARLAACGDLVHSLVERSGYDGALMPGFAAASNNAGTPAADVALDSIDHVALALPAGELDRWVAFYVSVLGFLETHQEDVNTEYSAMRSKVVQSPNGAARFPLMEPAAGRRRSQIDDYIRCHEGAGAQHLALRSRDIVKSVSTMARAIDFLPTPGAYYDALDWRVGELHAELAALRRYGILVDRDATGLLLQVFTKPLGPRPTLFMEVIERRGARGFGSGNIKALFEAVERTQPTATL